MLRKLEANLEETSIGFVIFLLVTIVPMAGVVLHCSYNIYIGNALETYDLIFMDHPVLTSLNVSYLEVLIADTLALILLIIGLVVRYNYYSDERDFIRKYNLKGKTGFASDMRVSSNSNRNYDYGGEDGGD